ncbi:hypothetical protein Tco_1111066 [Tanacetum coccineum]|uniref:Uncharacterized protein n=1 Tax=Tanacetum coccineum TaxID=301880 RepID=A0ABQ5IKK8_9ASTR
MRLCRPDLDHERRPDWNQNSGKLHWQDWSQEMSEVKKTDHSADVLASIRSQILSASHGPEATRIKNLKESEWRLSNPKRNKITDTRDAGANYSMHISDPESEHLKQSSDDIPMKDEGNDSDMEDTDNAHIPKVSTTTWFKPNSRTSKEDIDIGSSSKGFQRTGKKNSAKLMDECHKLLTNKVDLSNPEGHQILRNIYEPLPLGGPPGQDILKMEMEMEIPVPEISSE